MRILILPVMVMLLAYGCGKSDPAGPGDTQYYPLTVTLTDDHGRPVVNATVVTVPWNEKASTDSTGVATFEKELRGDTTSLYVQREFYEDHYQVLTREMLKTGGISISLDTSGPVVTIYRPAAGLVYYNSLMQFSAVAIDPEDGVLGEIVWNSDMDGELGNGSEITVGDISLGYHMITCNATDNDGNTGTADVSILVQMPTNPDPMSYFPLTPLSWWKYEHPVNRYNIVRESDGLVETWILGDIRVEIDSHLRRTTTLDIQYILGSIKKFYKYKVVDQLEVADNSIYVTGTVETMEMRENWLDNAIFFSAEVTTDYSPRYLLIPDTDNLSTAPDYHASILTELFWKYKHPFEDEVNFTESFAVDTNVSFGMPERVVSPMVTVEAIPVTYSHGDVQKTWWLAVGAGIVKMEYQSYAHTIALLESSSIPAFRPVSTSTSKAPPPQVSLPALKTAFRKAPPYPEYSELRRMREVVQGFLPR